MTWGEEGIELEAYQRHAEITIRDFGLSYESKGLCGARAKRTPKQFLKATHSLERNPACTGHSQLGESVYPAIVQTSGFR